MAGRLESKGRCDRRRVSKISFEQVLYSSKMFDRYTFENLVLRNLSMQNSDKVLEEKIKTIERKIRNISKFNLKIQTG